MRLILQAALLLGAQRQTLHKEHHLGSEQPLKENPEEAVGDGKGVFQARRAKQCH